MRFKIYNTILIINNLIKNMDKKSYTSFLLLIKNEVYDIGELRKNINSILESVKNKKYGLIIFLCKYLSKKDIIQLYDELELNYKIFFIKERLRFNNDLLFKVYSLPKNISYFKEIYLSFNDEIIDVYKSNLSIFKLIIFNIYQIL